ncbi:MAG: hypothetical protein HY610_01015, partial [Elusimicrobia bacterium]|nr:hypothetical protein [Elusimicrobiota bacterium]
MTEKEQLQNHNDRSLSIVDQTTENRKNENWETHPTSIGEIPYNILDERFKMLKKAENQKELKCFVIMPIGEKGSGEYVNNMAVFGKIICPTVQKSGFNIRCYHADMIGKTGWISKQIVEAIYNDDIVIADLRRKNPNVLYELGVRHTFGKRSILVYPEKDDNIFYTKTHRGAQYHIDGQSNKQFFNEMNDFIKDIIEN